jgi:hypothetical protein
MPLSRSDPIPRLVRLRQRFVRGGQSSAYGGVLSTAHGLVTGGGCSDDPHKTAPIPHGLGAGSSSLCQRSWAGLLVADKVCPGHCWAASRRCECTQAVASCTCNWLEVIEVSRLVGALFRHFVMPSQALINSAAGAVTVSPMAVSMLAI